MSAIDATTDARVVLERLLADGYVVVERLLDDATTADLRDRVQRLLDDERATPSIPVDDVPLPDADEQSWYAHLGGSTTTSAAGSPSGWPCNKRRSSTRRGRCPTIRSASASSTSRRCSTADARSGSST